MKFSYSLIKKFVPELKSQSQLVEALMMHSFETTNAKNNIIKVDVPSNRYSDTASHWGIAREAAAALDFKLKDYLEVKSSKNERLKKDKVFKSFKVSVEDKKLCRRMVAQYFDDIEIAPSPKWMQEVLLSCGMRPINNIVDITNYVMLETGQPLHAFDFEKMEGGQLIVRHAKRNESLHVLDGEKFALDPEILVLADKKEPLDIAGIKGGRKAEIMPHTRSILLTAANFDSVSVYRTSKKLNLVTDASVRFAHNLSPELAMIGLERAANLLVEVVGARPGTRSDSLTKPLPRHLIKFDIKRFNRLIGIQMDNKSAGNYLQRLGFKNVSKDKWEVPALRLDIQDDQDLAEEIIRLFDYNKLQSQAPHIALRPSESDDLLLFKSKFRKILVGLGLDEVYNYSFISDQDAKNLVFNNETIELKNPMSQEFQWLRPSLASGLMKNIEHNSKFFDKIRIFETGRTFFIDNNKKVSESNVLGIALAAKDKEIFFELKGLVDQLFKSLGLADYLMIETGNGNLKIKSNNLSFAYLGQSNQKLKGWQISLFEVDLDQLLQLVIEEKDYQPLSKYPSIMRDISILVADSVRIGEVIKTIQESNLHLIQDVDLVDEYIDEKWESLQSLTLRIIFQAQDRTLTTAEVDKEMKKVVAMLQNKFKAQIR